MITDIQITTVASVNVVTLEKAKKHLRVDLDCGGGDEDDLIQDYIDAAVTHAENYIGAHISDKEIVIKMTGFDNPLVFEASPIQSVTSVKYFEEGDEAEKTMDAENYDLTAETSKRFAIRFKGDLPNVQDRFDAVTVTISVGMATIDKAIAQAVLLMVADMYERREDRAEVLSTAAMSLLRSYKKF
jgi:uncharacterized phiE125 gp8 family phage protein